VEEKARHLQVPKGHWLLEADGEPVSYAEATADYTVSEPTLEYLSQAFIRAGLPDIAVFDFDSPAGLAVVRVLVPEAETWHATAGESRLGNRMRARLKVPL